MLSSTVRTLTRRRGTAARFMSSSPWSAVPLGAPDAILGLTVAFNDDSDDRKVSVGVGAYRGGDGKPYVLPSVIEAEKRVMAAGNNREYLPITGLAGFTEDACRMIYGTACDKPKAKTQVLSGTGGLRVGGDFIKLFVGDGGAPIYMPDPTWGNHKAIFTKSGLETRNYRYLDRSTQGLDFEGMLEDLSTVPAGSVVLLHACAHNPTGVDPSPEQWAEVSSALKGKGIVPFFDSAYQGFASGDAETDAFAVRQFVDDGHPVMCTQSFSKNFGLYSDRVGCLSFVCEDEAEKERIESQLKLVIRPMYSNPPATGARLVHTILGDETLNAQWYSECKGMADRIIGARAALRGELESQGSSLDWSHITDQIGMFAFTGLSGDQCAKMIKDHHVYLTSDGRVSMAGVTEGNAGYIASAMIEVTK